MRYIYWIIILNSLIFPLKIFAQRQEIKNIEKLVLEEDDFVLSKELAEKILRDGQNSKVDLSKLYLFLGIIYGAENERETATNYFERALLLDPTLMIPLNYAPKITMPFREARNLIQISLNMQINYPRSIIRAEEANIDVNIIGTQIDIVSKIKVYYRIGNGEYNFEEVDVKGMDKLKINLPVKEIYSDEMVDFYVEGEDEYGNNLLSKGSSEEPYRISYELAGKNTTNGAIVTTETETGVGLEVETGTPFYKAWWFWTVVGVVAVGAGVGIALGVTKPFDSGDPDADIIY